MRVCIALMAILAIAQPSNAGAQFSAPLPKPTVTSNGQSKFIRLVGDAPTDPTDVPDLILPQIGTGFSSDRAYVVSTAFTGQGKVRGHGFNVDVNGAKVVSTSDDADAQARKAISDTKSVVTLLIENSGDVGLRLYGCPGGCGPGPAGGPTNNVRKLLFGVSAGSYNDPGDTKSDPGIAFGPIVQYYAAFGLSDAKTSKGIGHLLIGGRAGLVALGDGELSGVGDSHLVRYASETVALVVNSAILFGATITQTQNALEKFIPGVQLTVSMSLK